MIKKVKLRDLTKEQYTKWFIKKAIERKCHCDTCQFSNIFCDVTKDNCWINHKELYPDKFLDQEIEIEVETPKLSKDEILILRYFSKFKKYKYIARDKNNSLFVYENKPFKYNDKWCVERILLNYELKDANLLSFITWEDEEPYSIEELLNDE